MAVQRIQAKRNETTRRILTTAASIFSKSGFAGARVDEIAKQAGVNKATIYYHIGDKKALYAQVLHNVFAHAADRFSENIKAEQSPEQKLKMYIRSVADLMDENPELAAIMLREQAGGGQNFPEMVVKDLTRILANLRDILEEGKQKGVFRTTVPLIVHFMIIGTIILVKMSAPVRKKFAPLAFPLNIDTGKDGDEAAAEIEKLVLNAVSK
jgi:AcrR family transcriptional regulator